MPSKARVVIPGVPCHVTQRGNNRQRTFFNDSDRERYLNLVSEYAASAKLQLLGWCLMPNHVHWIVLPEQSDSLSRTFRSAHGRYAQEVNARRERSGHLWQNRFFSCLLGDPHLWRALCYVERNPVRAGLARRADEYAWSSAAAHTELAEPPAWADVTLWRTRFTSNDWQLILDLDKPEHWIELRRATRLGQCWADSTERDNFAERTGAAMQSRRRGRPKMPACTGLL